MNSLTSVKLSELNDTDGQILNRIEFVAEMWVLKTYLKSSERDGEQK